MYKREIIGFDHQLLVLYICYMFFRENTQLEIIIMLYVLSDSHENFVTKLFHQLPHIQDLQLQNYLFLLQFGYSFVNLRQLSLYGDIFGIFNFELFKNLCNQLENIKIRIHRINEKKFFKLFDGYNFPYLVDLTIEFLDMKRLTYEKINCK